MALNSSWEHGSLYVSKRQRERDYWEWSRLFKTSNSISTDTLSPRPHLLIPPKQFHQLGTQSVLKHVCLWRPCSFKAPQCPTGCLIIEFKLWPGMDQVKQALQHSGSHTQQGTSMRSWNEKQDVEQASPEVTWGDNVCEFINTYVNVLCVSSDTTCKLFKCYVTLRMVEKGIKVFS